MKRGLSLGGIVAQWVSLWLLACVLREGVAPPFGWSFYALTLLMGFAGAVLGSYLSYRSHKKRGVKGPWWLLGLHFFGMGQAVPLMTYLQPRADPQERVALDGIVIILMTIPIIMAGCCEWEKKNAGRVGGG